MPLDEGPVELEIRYRFGRVASVFVELAGNRVARMSKPNAHSPRSQAQVEVSGRQIAVVIDWIGGIEGSPSRPTLAGDVYLDGVSLSGARPLAATLADPPAATAYFDSIAAQFERQLGSPASIVLWTAVGTFTGLVTGSLGGRLTPTAIVTFGVVVAFLASFLLMWSLTTRWLVQRPTIGSVRWLIWFGFLIGYPSSALLVLVLLQEIGRRWG